MLYSEGYLPCPYMDCTNRNVIPIVDLRRHVLNNDWLAHYIRWTRHDKPYYDANEESNNIVGGNDFHTMVCVAMSRNDQIDQNQI